ncbi:hypothetical protein SAMN05216474_0245 [Lishizhenia tianjinensis]|uniref:Dolichyl-phosphate-mannose-protein mannosyltransferase n=1 Tax=Lishizhenia tianjinensis TaxID=477690 RepID=A0A1I6XJ01_9FLAO|nr:hypothetical protein [Lishizhenia tianjinensis]SFT38325.1 hypothetical protein SAMN05216474_0245 [Lishizhenia tianjinensis]
MNTSLKQKITSKLHQPPFLFGFLVVVLLVLKTIVLVNYSFEFTSNDALIYWQGATDYAQGIFHEPYFYGQNYNPMLEALLALPLIKLGVSVELALPIVSSFVGVFPFVFIAFVLFKRHYHYPAYLFLLIPITLATEYDILTSLTRGFTSGIFICSFLIYPLLQPQKKSSFYLLGLICSLGFWFNANSVVFSLPVCLYLFFLNYKSITFYIGTLLAALPTFLLMYFANNFYVVNPSYLTHALGRMDFYLELIVEAFQHLDQFFRYLTPVIWSGNWLVLPVILVIGYLIMRKNWQKGVSIILGVIFILLSLGVHKIHDDIGVLFLSSVRMFLALPLLLGLALFWLNPQPKNSRNWNWIILTLVLFVGIRKITTSSSIVEKHTQTTNFGPIAIKDINELQEGCDELQHIVAKYDVDLVVYIADWKINAAEIGLYNYGCPILEDNAQNTVMNVYERRTWVFEEEKNKVRNNVLLYNAYVPNLDEIQKNMDCKVVQENPTLLLIENNTKTLSELSEIFNFPYKRHTY